MTARFLTDQDLREIEDLYRWGARVFDIEDLYDVHRYTIRHYMKRRGVPMRPPHRAPLAYAKDYRGSKNIKSIRPTIHGHDYVGGDRPTPDQLLCSSARAQRDMRTAKHR